MRYRDPMNGGAGSAASRGGPRIRRPTSFDVAREAGVSQTTVSLVLRQAHRGRVSPETVARVLEVADRLGYRPNEVGRSLKGGASRLIGLAVPDVTDPYFTTVMRGAEESAWASNHMVGLLATRGKESVGRLVDAVLGSWMTGLVICGPTPSELAGLAAIADRTVVLDGDAPDLRASIAYDIHAGMTAAVEHLTALGHTVIGQVTSTSEAQTVQRRRDSFERLRPRAPRLSVTYRLGAGQTIRDVTAFLRTNTDITALVCDTDTLAAEVLAAAADLGLDPPRDLSVIGFNDSDLARTVRPALTSVALPAADAGALAIELLTNQRSAERRHTLATQLVVRDSTTTPGRP